LSMSLEVRHLTSRNNHKIQLQGTQWANFTFIQVVNKPKLFLLIYFSLIGILGGKMKKVILCGPGSCCPIVEVGNETTVFSDDFGGTVKLSNEEWNILKDKIKSGEL